MTFCGYDPLMSIGLEKFGEGVAVSTLRKARTAGRPIHDHITLELEQLRTLIAELMEAEQRLTEPKAQRRATVMRGLALVVESCFSSARGITDEKKLREYFVRQFAHYGEMIRTIEDAYERSVLEASISERTKAAVEALNHSTG